MKNEKKGTPRKVRVTRSSHGSKVAPSDAAVLERVLRFAVSPEQADALANALLASHGDLFKVLAAGEKALSQTAGITAEAITLLKLVEWIRMYGISLASGRETTLPPHRGQLNLFAAAPGEAGAAKVTGEGAGAVGPEKTAAEQAGDSRATHPAPARKRQQPRPKTGLFTNAVLKETIALLPVCPATSSLDEIRAFLVGRLHYSAIETRRRYAGYIVHRMFPDGVIEPSLLGFAKAFPGTQDLKDVCFFRFLKAEPLEMDLVLELLLPNLGAGRLPRERIRAYLTSRFPGARSIKGAASAVVDALSATGIAKADRTALTFCLRDIGLAAFAFVLHSEFPDPGMYDIEKVETHRGIRALLWNPTKLIPSLYELRNQGILSKISEIDNVRQFTTRFTPLEVVERLKTRESRA